MQNPHVPAGLVVSLSDLLTECIELLAHLASELQNLQLHGGNPPGQGLKQVHSELADDGNIVIYCVQRPHAEGSPLDMWG